MGYRSWWILFGPARSLPNFRVEREPLKQPLSKKDTNQQIGQQSQYENRYGILGRLIGGFRHRPEFVRSRRDLTLVHRR